jgi:hypothetical protein
MWKMPKIIHFTIRTDQTLEFIPYRAQGVETRQKAIQKKSQSMEKECSIEKKREEFGEGEKREGPSTAPHPLLQHVWRAIPKLQQEARSSEAMRSLAQIAKILQRGGKFFPHFKINFFLDQF